MTLFRIQLVERNVLSWLKLCANGARIIDSVHWQNHPFYTGSFLSLLKVLWLRGQRKQSSKRGEGCLRPHIAHKLMDGKGAAAFKWVKCFPQLWPTQMVARIIVNFFFLWAASGMSCLIYFFFWAAWWYSFDHSHTFFFLSPTSSHIISIFLIK